MIDALNILVDDDLLHTFVNLISLVVALDVFCIVGCLISNVRGVSK